MSETKLRKEAKRSPLNFRFIMKAGIFLLIIVFAFIFVPSPYSWLAIVFIIIGFISIDALGHRVLFKMAHRNLFRRKGTTILVVAGLMVGTAIISTSFVVGDTLDNMIVQEITKGAGEVSFVIAANDDQGSARYFDEAAIGPLVEDIKKIDHVEFAASMVMERFVAYNPSTDLSSKSPYLVMGTNSSIWTRFGGWVDVSGNKIMNGPSVNGCYLFVDDAIDLGANLGDTIVLTKGDLIVPFTVEMIVNNYEPGLNGLSTSVFVDIETLRSMTGVIGQVNYIFIKTESFEGDRFYYNGQVRNSIDALIGPLEGTTGLKVVADVKQILDEGKQNLATISDLFLVFGSFSVIAGIVLVINIFTMLGEERKSEMGMARALGMRRADLERLFTYEGLLYATMATAVGALVGLALAYFMIWAISGTFDFFRVPIIDYFHFETSSLMISSIAGFLITVGTVYIATVRISKLNIVRAVRNIPEPPISKSDRRSFRLGVLGIVIGAVIMFIGIGVEDLSPAFGGLSLMTISLGLVIRKWVGDRIAWNLAGGLTLFIWIPKGDFEIFDYDSGIEIFIVSGLFMVTSALILVIFNSDVLVSFLLKIAPFKKGYRAVIKTAASYPLRAKFRTGLSIFIFGLVIFTVTVLSMLSGILNVNIERMVIESSGGFDLIAIKQLPVPFEEDPWEIINTTGGFVEKENVTNIIGLPAMPIQANFTGIDGMTGSQRQFERSTSIIGFNQRFYTEGEFPLSDWDRSLFRNEEDVWRAAVFNPSLVIVDGSWAAQSAGFGAPVYEGAVEIGQSIRLKSLSGEYENVTVIGIMKQQFFNGVFMSEAGVYANHHANGPTILLMNFREGLDVSRQAVLVEREFRNYGVVTVNVKEIARQVTSNINNMFSLFQAYLAMGLIIGITGLGIITIRSIRERQLEIGMMRAIGYRRSMVVANFALESAFISTLGIIIGSLLGIMVGYELYTNLVSEGYDFEFVINWRPIVLIGFGALIATLLCVYPAARGASRVSPAEVLRFE
ncbi:MAG: FtsX-like permease family protein [Methanomassiliicoccales archaeon]|nr:MAG: FtsX-like permease family protein [Methanomassiliicoccales archaeon]